MGPAGADGTQVTRATVYTVNSPSPAFTQAGFADVYATCLSNKDVLLAGSCATSNPFTLPVTSGTFYNDGVNMGVRQAFRCQAQHTAAGDSVILTAIARCLQVP
jgi:hypothetical protein